MINSQYSIYNRFLCRVSSPTNGKEIKNLLMKEKPISVRPTLIMMFNFKE